MSSKAELPPENIKPTRAKHIKYSFSPMGIAHAIVDLFSGVGQREPPSQTKTQHVRLITINVSHFCEKARWALDMVEAGPKNPIYYTEDAHPPPFVSFASVPASGDQASQTPMIVMPDGKVLFSSDKVLPEVCPFLYPPEIKEEIQALEADLGQRLGATIRCVCYHSLLLKENHAVCSKACGANTSKVESFLFDKLLDKGVAKAIRKLVHVNEETARVSESTMQNVFGEISERLQKGGGEYLMDTPGKSYGFTAADLTFAALAYPLIRPPEMKNVLPLEDSEVPPTLLKLSEQLRETRAGQHALRMYAKHRGGLVHVKTIGRDNSPMRKLGIFSVGAVGVAAAVIYVARSK